MDKAQSALKRFFNFDDFLDNQKAIVEAGIAGKDLCVIMPTGAGKSLCYQLPALMHDGYTIVVSPLISLMKDQLDALKERNISAECINSSINFMDQLAIMQRVVSGAVKLLYVAPERFGNAAFRNMLMENPPESLVVDEAHCISQWGHDFRPAYLKIGEFIRSFNIRQVCAFTATATLAVQKDICKQLGRTHMELMVAGFKRPNLAFSVINCHGGDEKLIQLQKILKKNAPTIIYASTRKAVEDLSGQLNCIAYHAGLTDEERTLAQDKFMNEPCPVLAATNAFGMGIDRADVRRVIHYNMPGSLEAYYQEAGRAGRDGENAECILLFSYADRFVQEFLIEMNNPPPDAVKKVWEFLCRTAKIENTDTLEITAGELAGKIPELKNDAMASSCLAILEKNGCIERLYRSQNTGSIRFTGDLTALFNQHANKKTQRSIFITAMLRHYGLKAAETQHCNYENLSEISGLNPEQLKRVLRALDNECIEWQPPFSGRASRILKAETQLEINFEELAAKHDFELSKLDDVINYTKSRLCRQAAIIEYFGEPVKDWQCGCCDLCSNQTSNGYKSESPAEQMAVKIILQAAEYFSGRLGGGKISLILSGAKRAEIIQRRLDRNPYFGKLSMFKQVKIMEILKSLEQSGYLERCGSSEYPCITISNAGRNFLKLNDLNSGFF